MRTVIVGAGIGDRRGPVVEALLLALRENDEPADALAGYAAVRMPRARRFQRESSRFARMALSEHTGPRDLVMRLTPAAVRSRALDWLLRA